MVGVVARPSIEDRYTRLARTTGILGITSVALLFGPIIALASAGEPSLEATGAEAAEYFGRLDATWPRLVMATGTLGMIGTLWFFVAFGFVLRRAEGDPPWRSTVAMLSGALLAAYGLIGSSTEAASIHGAKITPEVAAYAFARGSVGFANVWIAIASFSISSGWVILSTRVLERWMGWWLVATGVGLVACRFVWRSELWLLPYMLFWLWVLVLSIRLLRRPSLPDRAQS